MRKKLKKLKDIFRKTKWLFFHADDHSLSLDKVNALSFQPFVVSVKASNVFNLRNISSGKYCLRIAHRNEKLFNTRKGLIIAFDLSETKHVNAQRKKLGLNKSSEKYGVFEYLGGGIRKDDFYIQDMYLDIPGEIKLLNITLHSLMPKELIYIESLQFFDTFLPEKSITILDQSTLPKNMDVVSDNLMNIDELVERKKLKDSNILLYADITPNVIDGSSIWLTSIINILSIDYKVLVLFKDNINPEKNIISNIVNDRYQYIEPKDLGLIKPLTNEVAVNILKKLDKSIPTIKAIVTRGYDLAVEVQKDDTFIGRRFTYLTDFYSVTDTGLNIPDNRRKTLNTVVANADYLLVQTDQIKDKLSALTSIKSKTIALPPTLPSNLSAFLSTPDIKKGEGIVNIGYAGKVQPRWGVEELLEWSSDLRKKGIKIHLHIATGKIYSANKQDGFVAKINKLLKEDFVTLYSGLDRFGAMSLMNGMDFVWCYRKSILEDSTLEVSTKLIEMAALGKPSICYPSNINQNLLGKDYPCFIKSYDDFMSIFNTKKINSFNFQQLSETIRKTYSFDNVVKNFSFLQEQSNVSGKKIVIAGHDLKFINPWVSSLKKDGYQVKVDEWEWGKAVDLKRSEQLLEWADIVFCEWGLANAAWYSQKNINKKPLFIRAHAQEVRDKARKFGKAINIENVTKVIFVADHIRKQALELWNWPESKTTVIPNFLLTDKFPLIDKPLGLNLGMVGIIPQTKRFDRAIDLLVELVKSGKDAHLYIKGHRPEDLPFMHAPGRKKELEYYDLLYKKIDAIPDLKSRIHFDPWGNDVAEWYQKIDFILSPSDAESFHYALADGVLSGCLPIVWNWENSDIIYPKDWVVNSLQEAINKIELYAGYQRDNVIHLRQSFRKYLFKKYSSEIIFNQLSSLILN